MRWVTRENAVVDRIACPWLIRRFVDPAAEFLFVPPERVMDVARERDAIPYDVPDVELGHVDGRCSFESIVLRYGLAGDPALALVARVVHAADVSEDVNTIPEGPGLVAIAKGFRLLHGTDDAKKIALESPLYDALYAWAEREVGASRA